MYHRLVLAGEEGSIPFHGKWFDGSSIGSQLVGEWISEWVLFGYTVRRRMRGPMFGLGQHEWREEVVRVGPLT